MKRRLLISAPTGFIVRNLLLGKFLQMTADKFSLIVAVPNPESKELLDAFANHDVKFIPYPTFASSSKKFTSQLADPHFWIYLLSIGSKNNQSIKNYVLIYDTRKNVIYRLFRNCVFFIGSVLQKTRLMHLVLKWYVGYYRTHSLTVGWEKKLTCDKIDLVLSTVLSLTHKNAPSSDLPLVVAANKLSIPIVTLIQSWDNLSSKPNIIPDFIHSYLVWSDIQRRELLGYFYSIPSEKVHYVGAPQFDFHRDNTILIDRATYLRKMGFDESDKYILIATGMEKSLPNEIAEVVFISEAILRHLGSVRILLRIHPKDNSLRVKEFLGVLKRLNVIVEMPNTELHMDHGGFTPPEYFYQNQINAIYHSELVINTASTITVDAAILNKPIISIAYNYLEDSQFSESRSLKINYSSHFEKIANTKGVRLAISEKQLLMMVRMYLQDSGIDSEERKSIENTVTKCADGKAGQRIVENLISVLE